MSMTQSKQSHLNEESENIGRSLSGNPTIGNIIIAARFGRREFLRNSLGVAAIAATVSPLALIAADEARADVKSRLFKSDQGGI